MHDKTKMESCHSHAPSDWNSIPSARRSRSDTCQSVTGADRSIKTGITRGTGSVTSLVSFNPDQGLGRSAFRVLTREVLRRYSERNGMHELIFIVEEAPEGGFTARRR